MNFNTRDYGKPDFRRNVSQMPYPMKVNCVIDMQERLMPIRLSRGEIVKPWRRDLNENDSSEQASFYAHLRSLVPENVVAESEKAMMAYRELSVPQIFNVQVEECTHAN